MSNQKTIKTILKNFLIKKKLKLIYPMLTPGLISFNNKKNVFIIEGRL